MKRLRFLLLMIPVFIVGAGYVASNTDDYFEIAKNLDIFGRLYKEVNTRYVDEVNPTKLMQTGIDAMLSSLDPYTVFISESEIEDFKFMNTGQYGGVGASLDKQAGRFVITEIYKDAPAEKAGLRVGDEVLEIESEVLATTRRSDDEIKEFLRGEKGTLLHMKVRRPGEDKPLTFAITRDRIRVPNVPFYGMVNDEVGYIALTGFTQDAGKEVEDALLALKRNSPNLSGVILDLRGNPGGRLDEAVNVSNVFLPIGEKIVETRGKLESSRKVHIARNRPIDTEIPLVVLVNGKSASASEIVAGAIQDLDRGVILGQRSFGKGLVQNIRPLSYNTQMKITTAKYYTPSGRCIQAIDYSHHNSDGTAGRIPDSLRKSFTTRGGRTVFDGGGIFPDIEVSKQEVPVIVTELEKSNLIFDYATQFARKMAKIEEPRTYTLSPKVYAEFVQYAREQGFSYETRAERQLTKLHDNLADDNYLAELSDELDALSSQLRAKKANDFQTYQEPISRMLRMEISRRYYYKEGELMSSFLDDPNILEGVKVLNDTKRYNVMLARH